MTVEERDHETGRPFWFTPGGGVEPGETYEQASPRELFEETGLRDVPLGRCVWVHDHTWRWKARPMRSVDRYYLSRTETTHISEAHRTDLEYGAMLAHRWWSIAEMIDTTDLFAPRELIDLLGPLLRGAVPVEPLHLG